MKKKLRPQNLEITHCSSIMIAPLCNCQSFSYNDFTFGILLYIYMDLFFLIFLPSLINFQIYTYA